MKGRAMTQVRRISRRAFLAASAVSAAPTILPRGVLGIAGMPGANDRIVTGHIGLGGMGRAHLERFREHVGAVCDVDANHLADALNVLGRKVDVYTDYRALLDRHDIDAVVVATPDHWHGLQTVHACQAGKDVYVEKPLCKTIEEGRAMIRAARRFGRVVQVGSQGRSAEDVRAACLYIRNGQLGRVKRVECWHPPNPTGGDPAKTGNPPPELDWDLWLGPARWKPYNPDYCHFNFRWMLDFGGGWIRDRGAHVFAAVFWCLDLDYFTSPVRITATGRPPREGLWDVPPTLDVEYVFRDLHLTIMWAQPGTPPVDYEFGAKFEGEKDSLVLKGGHGGCGTEDKAMTYTPPADGVRVSVSPGHRENWLACIKSREDPVMPVEAGHAVASLCTLGNLSYQLGRPLEWDPVKEQVGGDAEANRMLAMAGRGPWRL